MSGGGPSTSTSQGRAFWRPGTVGPGSDVVVQQQTRLEGGGGAAESITDPALSLDGLLTFNSHRHLHLSQQKLLLPIAAHRRSLLFSVQHHQVTLLVGATGSGKTTRPLHLPHRTPLSHSPHCPQSLPHTVPSSPCGLSVCFCESDQKFLSIWMLRAGLRVVGRWPSLSPAESLPFPSLVACPRR